MLYHVIILVFATVYISLRNSVSCTSLIDFQSVHLTIGEGIIHRDLNTQESSVFLLRDHYEYHIKIKNLTKIYDWNGHFLKDKTFSLNGKVLSSYDIRIKNNLVNYVKKTNVIKRFQLENGTFPKSLEKEIIKNQATKLYQITNNILCS